MLVGFQGMKIATARSYFLVRIFPVGEVPVRFGCPMVGCLAALTGSPELGVTSIDPNGYSIIVV